MKLNKELIRQLACGEIAVQHDTAADADNLSAILKAAFPKDGYHTVGALDYYEQSAKVSKDWAGTSTPPKKPIFQEKDFFIVDKLVGYKAPTDLFAGSIPQGTIYKPIQSGKAFYYCAIGSNKKPIDSGRTNLPSEIVETWEQVYETVIQTQEVTIGKRPVQISSQGTIRGTRSYSIGEWEKLYEHLRINPTILGDYAIVPTNVTFSIGCENNCTSDQVKNLIDTYYLLNPKS